MLKKILNILHSWNGSTDSSCASLEHPSLGIVQSQVSERKWLELEESYVNLSIEDRHFVLNGVAEIGAPGGWYDEWLESGSNLAGLFSGATLMVAAWKARGGLRGKWVTSQQGADFSQLLSMAFDLLIQAHQNDSSDPEPIARLIRVMMGLQSGLDQYYEAYDRLEATGATHLGASWYMIDALSPKWGGGEQEMISFAQTQSEKEDCLVSLIPLAHIENWLHIDMFDKNESKARQYFQAPMVKQEILNAYEIHTQQRTDCLFDLLARNAFAFALWKMGEHGPASSELDFIGTRLSPKPWAYVNGNLYGAANEARVSLNLPKL